MVVALWTQFSILLAITAFYLLLALYFVANILRKAGLLNRGWISRVLRLLG